MKKGRGIRLATGIVSVITGFPSALFLLVFSLLFLYADEPVKATLCNVAIILCLVQVSVGIILITDKSPAGASITCAVISAAIVALGVALFFDLGNMMILLLYPAATCGLSIANLIVFYIKKSEKLPADYHFPSRFNTHASFAFAEPPPQFAPPPPPNSLSERVAKLDEMKANGEISEAEYKELLFKELDK